MAREMLAGEMLAGRGPNCLITGGEPVVRLVDAAQRGKGGRNQQLVLAALIELSTKNDAIDALRGLVLLSGGTDGEDGPTDAAGALVDEDVARRVVEQKLDPRDFLSRNDAYTFFERTGGLIKTGPTHTNVCDVRVVLVDR
jgi:hydroxypyruvate reductase